MSIGSLLAGHQVRGARASRPNDAEDRVRVHGGFTDGGHGGFGRSPMLRADVWCVCVSGCIFSASQKKDSRQSVVRMCIYICLDDLNLGSICHLCRQHDRIWCVQGPPLHALIIVGETHELEQTMLDHFRVAPTPAGIQADKDAAALKESENLTGAWLYNEGMVCCAPVWWHCSGGDRNMLSQYLLLFFFGDG